LRNTLYEFDLQPGGAWRFIMYSADGVHFPNESVFQKIAQPERIVFKHPRSSASIPSYL
jgi:uncharacterized protein YndB with AHSA1/START domain